MAWVIEDKWYDRTCSGKSYAQIVLQWQWALCYGSWEVRDWVVLRLLRYMGSMKASHMHV